MLDEDLHLALLFTAAGLSSRQIVEYTNRTGPLEQGTYAAICQALGARTLPQAVSIGCRAALIPPAITPDRDLPKLDERQIAIFAYAGEGLTGEDIEEVTGWTGREIRQLRKSAYRALALTTLPGVVAVLHAARVLPNHHPCRRAACVAAREGRGGVPDPVPTARAWSEDLIAFARWRVELAAGRQRLAERTRQLAEAGRELEAAWQEVGAARSLSAKTRKRAAAANRAWQEVQQMGRDTAVRLERVSALAPVAAELRPPVPIGRRPWRRRPTERA
ncbi:hypothetical protein [Kitasatospora sp. NPDC088548]|uniref:hypothetical protein n=1 Tax=Kitasatospora sp. NPDC088548 TaxID=3364075 RepID=UPI0037FC0172